MTGSHCGPALEQVDEQLRQQEQGHIFTASIPTEVCSTPGWVHMHSALKQPVSGGDKILYL